MSRLRVDDHPLTEVQALRNRIAAMKDASVFDMRSKAESAMNCAVNLIESLVERVEMLERRVGR